MMSFCAFAGAPMDMMASLTEEQRTCVTTHGCVVPEQPETTEALNAYMDCMKNATVACGLQLPDLPAPQMPAPEAPVMDIPAPEVPVMDIPAPEAPVMDIPAPEAPQE